MPMFKLVIYQKRTLGLPEGEEEISSIYFFY